MVNKDLQGIKRIRFKTMKIVKFKHTKLEDRVTKSSLIKVSDFVDMIRDFTYWLMFLLKNKKLLFLSNRFFRMEVNIMSEYLNLTLTIGSKISE